MFRRHHSVGFTLAELLFVVAIIGVLSLIAIPNLLEARIRANVTKVYSDMRMMHFAVETYFADHGTEPIGAVEGMILYGWGESDTDKVYNALTTPISYLTDIPVDPFGLKDSYRGLLYRSTRRIAMVDAGLCPGCPEAARRGYIWLARSRGPGGTRSEDFHPPIDAPEVLGGLYPSERTYIYDPTNGVVSNGWIICTNKGIYTRPSSSY